ncbi:hypothetical protein QFC19_001059 [Naganishia cerealis]|uniref:Uncharacterized protein n=1 Tax=Naganishia cerealis TaxID=610337 RepID=A0ACC2WJ10_9TREE|nr:hypothetical protein QFC19_001059 [Naganishia cerealis]
MSTTDVVRSHLAHSSIRGQTSTLKKKQQAAAKTNEGKREKNANDRPLVKAVLASPLLPKWPDVHPAFNTVLTLLCEAMPEVASYHTSRDRCQAHSKRYKRELSKLVPAHANPQPPIPLKKDSTTDIVPSSVPSQTSISSLPGKSPPEPPSILQHVLFGINQVVKALEKQKLQLEVEVDMLLSGREPNMDQVPAGANRHTLIPTAPPPTLPTNPQSVLGRPTIVPLRAIFVCIQDINPREMVDHLPTYVSTYNGFVQHARSKLKQWCKARSVENGEANSAALQRAREKMEILAGEGEVLLVPLAAGSEQVLAHAVGLRRVSMLGVTAQADINVRQARFPHFDVLKRITQDAGLKPLLPPFQIYALAPPAELAAQLYAPTQLKAVHTTLPADTKARKAKRVEEVKRVREEKKQQKAETKARTKVVGMMVKGQLYGGTEQKKRDRQARMEKRKRVEQMVANRQKRRKVKAQGGQTQGGQS